MPEEGERKRRRRAKRFQLSERAWGRMRANNGDLDPGSWIILATRKKIIYCSRARKDSLHLTRSTGRCVR